MSQHGINPKVTSTRGISRNSTLPALIIAGVGYLLLAIFIKLKPTSLTDLHITRHLQSNEHPFLQRVMHLVSWFGFRPQSLLLPVSVITGFWCLGRRLESTLLVMAWGSSMISFLTKQVVRRPRPDHTVVRVVAANLRDTSFPSGHVLHYVTFWGFVVYLLLVLLPWRGARWLVSAVMLPIISLVGPSRVYLGHHWFSDVLGSYLLGSAYLAGLIELHRVASSDTPSTDGPLDERWVTGARQWLR